MKASKAFSDPNSTLRRYNAMTARDDNKRTLGRLPPQAWLALRDRLIEVSYQFRVNRQAQTMLADRAIDCGHRAVRAYNALRPRTVPLFVGRRAQ